MILPATVLNLESRTLFSVLAIKRSRRAFIIWILWGLLWTSCHRDVASERLRAPGVSAAPVFLAPNQRCSGGNELTLWLRTKTGTISEAKRSASVCWLVFYYFYSHQDQGSESKQLRWQHQNQIYEMRDQLKLWNGDNQLNFFHLSAPLMSPVFLWGLKVRRFILSIKSNR